MSRMNDDHRARDVNRSSSSPDASGDPRLLAAVQEYMAAVEAGRRPSRHELLARHPDIADELSACLHGLAFVRSAAQQITGSSPTTPSIDDPGFGAELSARPLGDFRLVREIGRGGMGVVYEAVQLSLDRRVAVKVLPMAAALDDRQLQRFRNEAQAAAQLHHTNIVPVYAVGCERSVHFYAMQLIDGQSLSDVIADLRNAAGRPAVFPERMTEVIAPGCYGLAGDAVLPSFSTTTPSTASRPASAAVSATGLSALHSGHRGAYFRAVARLGLQAAEALEYAHQFGVVHRDIKPANLLLDARGNMWITDFGLAHVYSDTGMTQTGDLVGTLRYMSPEQASGRAVVLDQRTDVYSLGVTLYELLTLERAVSAGTREQLLYRISYDEPRSPRAIDRAIPPELEIILAKATAKEPADRYASAGAMAEDLRRFLSDQPLLAKPPSLRDKAVKWGRRHRSLVISALVVLSIAALGLLTSTLLIAREQAKTQAAFLRERDKVIEAKRSFEQARQAVDFFSHVAAVQMDDPRFTEVRKELLEAALDYYQGFLKEHQDDRSIEGELTAAQSHVSSILGELSALDEYSRVRFRAELLREPSVSDALQLSAEQDQSIQERWSAEFLRRPPGPGSPEMRQLTSEQKRAKFAGLAGDLEAAVNKILTPKQAMRLRQIARQAAGPAAFSDPEIIDALSLTREQRDAIRGIQSQFMREGFRRQGPGRQPPPEQRRGPGPATGPAPSRPEDAVSQILSHLTPAQVQTWRDLTGEAFIRRPFPGRGGPPFGGPDLGRGGPPFMPGP